jgi:hypothetical protein
MAAMQYRNADFRTLAEGTAKTGYLAWRGPNPIWTAKTPGLTVPPTMLTLADEVIE